MQLAQKDLAKYLASNCSSVDGVLDKMKELFRDTLQEMLEAEMSEHLGYEKHESAGNNTGNSRNGYSKKTLKTKLGPACIEIPRDRNGDFEPRLIKKYGTTLNGIEDQVIGLYAKGMSTRDIEDQMHDIYGIDVSPTLVSRITDRIMPQVAEWQSRPLDPVYPIVYLDAIHFKVRSEHRIIKKAAYSVLALNTNGIKEILGIWIGENESASFWLGVCNDLKSRGVSDILIACTDGLKGFSDAIEAVFPKTEIQLCVIHQIRNSLRYVSWKDCKRLMEDLKKTYKASSLDEAERAFSVFREIWGQKYPGLIKSWEEHWLDLTTYFKYHPSIRHIIYTTNIIEGYHRQLRKVTKTKTAYPTDDSLRKVLYLATMDITKKWTMPVRDWKECMSQFMIYFPDRVNYDLKS